MEELLPLPWCSKVRKNPFELLVSSSDISGLAQVDGMTDQAGELATKFCVDSADLPQLGRDQAVAEGKAGETLLGCFVVLSSGGCRVCKPQNPSGRSLSLAMSMVLSQISEAKRER